MKSTEQIRNSEETPPLFTDPPPEYTRETPTPDVTMATGKTKGSVKYEDIILKSLLVCSGSPAVYQLRPKKEEIGSLRRMTLGEKDLNKSNRTILLVGETGTGKSTLINTLVNYSMGVKWEDDVWFQIVEEEERNQSESQTSDVIVYQIFGFEGKTLPYSLTIIDTPGYGDTGGIKGDIIITERLLDWFRSDDGVHEVNAVGLVLKAAENRLNDRLMYIFDSVVSLFGKNMEQNIVTLITHSDGLTPENALKALEAANIKCAKDEKNQPVHFLFDNCQQEDRTEDTEEFQHAFTKTSEGLKKFTDFLEETRPQQLKTTVEVLNSRIRLTACIQNLKERIQLTELKQTEIRQTQEALKKHEEEMMKDDNFTVEVDEAYKEKESINKGYWGLLFYEGAVCCTVCEENCHYPGCTMAPSPERCEVMKDGRCTSCTRKCPVSDHVKEDWIYVTKTRRVKKTLQDMKEKYEKEKSDFESLLINLKKEMKELEKERDQMLDETFQHVVNLQQIALKLDSLSTHVHLDFLIEKMKEKGDKEKIQKLEEMKRRVDERTRAAMRYKHTTTGEEEMKTKGSVKHEDIILKSLLVRSGSPAVYQLRPKKEEIGSLRRMTLGEKDLNQSNRTILLVGETGAGKSTLVNTLVNYSMGVKWEDDVWFQIVEEEERKQAQSQTSDVIVYQIFGFEGKTLPYSLTIIDTPGYGDIRGIERDAAVSERLLDWFRSDDGVHEINAVGLVLKATENRLDDRLMYIFDSVVSLFGKNMEQNIVALITHPSGTNYKNALKALEAANIKCAKDEKNQPVHFLFNNMQQEDRTEDTEEYLQHAFTESTKGLKKFTDFLEKTRPQQLKTTMEVLKSRIRLTACIQNLKERIQLTELKQREIQQTQEALKKHEEEMKNDEKFTVEVDEGYKEKQTIRAGRWWLWLNYDGAVCCTVCEENCHYPGCTLAWSPESCAVMKDGRCTSCTRKCPVSDHVKENWIYVTKTRRVKKTLRDLKGTYEKDKSDCDKKKSLLENLQKEIKELEKERDQMLDESFHHVINLQQIALKVDSVSTHVHLDFLIEKMKEKGDTEKIQKLKEMKRRVDERTRAAMRYRQTAAGEEAKK